MPFRVILCSLYIISHVRYGERNLPFHCLKSSSFGRPGELRAESNRDPPCEASAAACWRCKVRWNWKVLRTRWPSPRPLVLPAGSRILLHVLRDEAIARDASNRLYGLAHSGMQLLLGHLLHGLPKASFGGNGLRPGLALILVQLFWRVEVVQVAIPALRSILAIAPGEEQAGLVASAVRENPDENTPM